MWVQNMREGVWHYSPRMQPKWVRRGFPNELMAITVAECGLVLLYHDKLHGTSWIRDEHYGGFVEKACTPCLGVSQGII